MLTLTMPIGPDLVALLTASAAAAGLPLDEHAENLLRGALGLPGYGREQGRPTFSYPTEKGWVTEKETENICGPQPPRIQEVSSAVEKALRQDLEQSNKQLQRLKEALRQQVTILGVVIPQLFGPGLSVSIADKALASLRYLSETKEQPSADPTLL